MMTDQDDKEVTQGLLDVGYHAYMMTDEVDKTVQVDKKVTKIESGIDTYDDISS